MEPASSPTRTRPSRGDELQLTIDSLAFGGAGVARLDGYVVFVADGIPGDRVRAVVEKSKRAYAQARAIEVLEPSPERVQAVAAHPGAPWQVLPYERQLEAKQAQVDDALRRIGRLDGFELEPIVPADDVWRYRNKLEYSFGRDVDGRLVCGFHAPGRWEEIVEVTDCLLASVAGNAVRERVVSWCREQGLSAYDRRTSEGFLRNLVIREGRRSGELQVRLVTSPGRLDTEAFAHAVDGVAGLLWTQLDSVAETTQGGATELVAGSDRLEEEIGGMRIQISPHAFFQTNTEMAERLYRLAIGYAAPTGSDRVYDLYCGIGTIGLLMAPRSGEEPGIVHLVQTRVSDRVGDRLLD